jgi:hypothetical protein
MSSNSQQLVAERSAMAKRIVSLEAVAHAALLDGKKPQAFQRLQTEIRSLRARVRTLDQAIRQQSDGS